MTSRIGALTDEEFGCLRRFADAITEGTYCPDSSPFHGDLVQRAAEEIARLKSEAQTYRDLAAEAFSAYTAFIRLGDAMDPLGKKVLAVIEMQSKRPAQ